MMGKTPRRPKYPQHCNCSQLLKTSYCCEALIIRVPFASASQSTGSSLNYCLGFRAHYDFIADFVVRFIFKGYISGQE